jgi:hypothetical protein
VVENEWQQTSAGLQLAAALSVQVRSCESYAEFAGLMVELLDDPALREPVVLLDAGLPDACRLTTVQRCIADFPRARVILWTGDRTTATHAGALIDGAYAALPKTVPLSTIVRVVERVGNGRRWCEPDQAQWMADFLAFLAFQAAGDPGHVWQAGELSALPDTVGEQDRLIELARGEPMPVNDDWFVRVLQLIRPRWLPPYLRRVIQALALYPTRAEAAAAIDLQPGTMNGYASSLSGRLMPHRYTTVTDQRGRDHSLIRIISLMHAGCDLRIDQHDLSADAFGIRSGTARPPEP